MKLRLIPEAVTKQITEAGYYYAGLVTATAHDGKTHTYAVKTRNKRTDAGKIEIKTNDGYKAAPFNETTVAIGEKLTVFLALFGDRFSGQGDRLKANLSDKFLSDDTKRTKGDTYAGMSDYLVFIDGCFVKVTNYKTYHRLPADISTGWQAFTPTHDQLKVIQAVKADRQKWLDRNAMYWGFEHKRRNTYAHEAEPF